MRVLSQVSILTRRYLPNKFNIVLRYVMAIYSKENFEICEFTIKCKVAQTSNMVSSNDLRWRMIYFVFGIGMTLRNTAALLGVHPVTVSRITCRFLRTGHVRPAKLGRPDLSTLLTRPQMMILMDFVLRNPSAYLREICTYMLSATGSDYTASSLRRVMRRAGYNRKRVSETNLASYCLTPYCLVYFISRMNNSELNMALSYFKLRKIALEKLPELQDVYRHVISIYRPEELVFIDESFFVRIIRIIITYYLTVNCRVVIDMIQQ